MIVHVRDWIEIQYSDQLIRWTMNRLAQSVKPASKGLDKLQQSMLKEYYRLKVQD